MKSLIAIALTMVLVGCTTEQPTPPTKVKMSAATEVCFEAAEALTQGFKDQKLDPSTYITVECGSDLQAKAFKEKNYEVSL